MDDAKDKSRHNGGESLEKERFTIISLGLTKHLQWSSGFWLYSFCLCYFLECIYTEEKLTILYCRDVYRTWILRSGLYLPSPGALVICRGLLISSLAAHCSFFKLKWLCLYADSQRESCEKMAADKHTMCFAVHTVCVLKFGVIVEVPLCSEASVQLPEQGSPAALIVSFINQGWFHTPVNTELIISNKQANKSHLQNGPPQMNLLVHTRIWENYINAGSCGCLNVPVLPHNGQKALERETLELGLTQVAIVDDLLILVIWVILCVPEGPEPRYKQPTDKGLVMELLYL